CFSILYLLEERREADEGERHARRPGQLEQALDDPIDALELARHHALEAIAEARVVEPGRHPADERAQGRERVLDLVGEAGGEGADGGQTIRAPELALELAHHGEIAQDADRAEVLAVAALEARRGQLDRQRAAIAPSQRERHVADGGAARQRLHQDVADLRREPENLRAVASARLTGE